MDAEYLKKNVGDVLADGLAACMVQSPDDPVDFLSQFLLNYVENRKRAEGQPHHAVAIQQLELASNTQQLKRIAALEAQTRTRTQRLQAERDFIDRSRKLIWPIEVVNEFVNLLGSVLNATGVYAGIVEERDGQKCVRYFTATPGHEFMIGERLQPPAITLSLLEPEPEAEQEQEADNAEAPVVQRPYQPKTLHIPNTVLGENLQKLRFFRRKDVGSYGAVLIEYRTLLHDAALALEDGTYRLDPTPRPEPEPVQVDEEPAINSEQRGKEETAAEPELIEAPRVPTHVLIAFDTMGQSREISQAEFQEATRLSLVLRDLLLEADVRAFDTEREWRRTVAKFAASSESGPPSDGDAAAAEGNP